MLILLENLWYFWQIIGLFLIIVPHWWWSNTLSYRPQRFRLDKSNIHLVWNLRRSELYRLVPRTVKPQFLSFLSVHESLRVLWAIFVVPLAMHESKIALKRLLHINLLLQRLHLSDPLVLKLFSFFKLLSYYFWRWI